LKIRLCVRVGRRVRSRQTENRKEMAHTEQRERERESIVSVDTQNRETRASRPRTTNAQKCRDDESSSDDDDGDDDDGDDDDGGNGDNMAATVVVVVVMV
jgi:hypothetical protein